MRENNGACEREFCVNACTRLTLNAWELRTLIIYCEEFMKSQFVLPEGGPLEELLFRGGGSTDRKVMVTAEMPGGIENVTVDQVD